MVVGDGFQCLDEGLCVVTGCLRSSRVHACEVLVRECLAATAAAWVCEVFVTAAVCATGSGLHMGGRQGSGLRHRDVWVSGCVLDAVCLKGSSNMPVVPGAV